MTSRQRVEMLGQPLTPKEAETRSRRVAALLRAEPTIQTATSQSQLCPQSEPCTCKRWSGNPAREECASSVPATAESISNMSATTPAEDMHIAMHHHILQDEKKHLCNWRSTNVTRLDLILLAFSNSGTLRSHDPKRNSFNPSATDQWQHHNSAILTTTSIQRPYCRPRTIDPAVRLRNVRSSLLVCEAELSPHLCSLAGDALGPHPHTQALTSRS